MSAPNTQWLGIIAEAGKVRGWLRPRGHSICPQNVEVLMNAEAVKQINNILKQNVRACAAIGHAFVCQLTAIYMDMLLVYKTMSENIAGAIASSGELITRQPIIRGMRAVKKEILKLISTWIAKSEDNELVRLLASSSPPFQSAQVMANFIPPLLDAVLGDYQTSIPDARDPEVLSTMTVIVSKLKVGLAIARCTTHALQGSISSEVITIFNAVFEATLTMINQARSATTGAANNADAAQDFETFPDHRLFFFQLMQSITANCFDGPPPAWLGRCS